MYHAIIIDQSLHNPQALVSFKTIHSKISGSWLMSCIEVPADCKEDFTRLIQLNLKSNQPWYAHMYNKKEVIIILRSKTFIVTTEPVSWQPFLEYGKALNIPADELVLSPVTFEEETAYFDSSV